MSPDHKLLLDYLLKEESNHDSLIGQLDAFKKELGSSRARSGAPGWGSSRRRACFTIRVANERFTVPADAEMSLEHERREDGEELELQLRWKPRGRVTRGPRS